MTSQNTKKNDMIYKEEKDTFFYSCLEENKRAT